MRKQSSVGSWVARRVGGAFLFGVATRAFQRQRVSPRAAAPKCERSPHLSQQSRWRGGAAFGSAFAFPNGSTTTTPAPRGLCEKCPNSVAELPLPLGAAALALGGASPQRLLRGDGGDAGGDAAQNRARRFGAKRVCPESAPLPGHRFATRYRSGDMRSVFLLRRASPPCPMKSGRFRAQHTATPAGAAPRAAFGYSRANWDSTRTLRGRSARGARIGRPSIGGASGHFKHVGGRRARRGRCLGRGKNSAGSGDSLEIVHLFSKRIGDAWREASRRIAVGESRRSIGGRIVRE